MLHGGDAHLLQDAECERILASHRSHAVHTSQETHALNNVGDKWIRKDSTSARISGLTLQSGCDNKPHVEGNLGLHAQ